MRPHRPAPPSLGATVVLGLLRIDELPDVAAAWLAALELGAVLHLWTIEDAR